MKIRLSILTVFCFVLSSCLPHKPEIAMTEVPPGPLVQAIEQRRGALLSLRAAGRVQVERKGRKRAFESVAFLVKGQEKLLVEGYGPLGDSLFSLLWDGNDILLRAPGERSGLLTPGKSDLERLIGFTVDPRELCAVLWGTLPKTSGAAAWSARCAADGSCVLEVREAQRSWRAAVRGDMLLTGYEAYQDGALAYRSRFEDHARIGDVVLPHRIVLENPGRTVRVVMEYEDASVNLPLGDDAFVLPGGSAPRDGEGAGQ